MVLVEFEYQGGTSTKGGKVGTLFLEESERVRVALPTAALDLVQGCRPLSVTSLRPQDELLVVWSELGTHVGKRINSKVNE
jgi:hypothetical protein